ncbi:endonuclease [Bacillus pseudomycoides]|uniref:HNH endonuclease n=1 Tax=Bacillus pseudomycoides TaxID=64104 RepID=UPI000BEE139A|nr:HNH endonuclease signature motif containing protein [Bacillus pseudomycoides]PDZ12775.1 endonuclease [Bacillus pseudomycoides]PFW91294.1 endonuclease [Bacillus pseudomycoides]PFX40446.1 endonuclease [Bacillus pseudomycoides]
MKYCNFNDCNNKVTKGLYCEEHKRKKKKSKNDIYHHENKPFYRSDKWQAMRSFVYEREQGCCQRCGRFVFGRQAHVHHVISIRKNPLLKLDPNNLRLLCPGCHMIEENEDEDKKQNVFPSYFNC